MSTRSVRTPSHALAILDDLRLSLRDWTVLWARIEARLPDAQRAWWDSRFGGRLFHSRETIEQRAAGLGRPVREARRRRAVYSAGTYYDRNRPGGRARPDHPYFEWTGSLRRATERFTTRERVRVAIDTARAYRGPLEREFADPIESLLVRSKGVEPWNERALDRIIEEELAAWVEELAENAGSYLPA